MSASSPTVTAMDATFSPAPTTSTVANSGAGGSEGWASFDDMNKVKDGGQGQEGWADFTSFDKMSGDAGVSAPLSMETDSAPRPASYCKDCSMNLLFATGKVVLVLAVGSAVFASGVYVDSGGQWDWSSGHGGVGVWQYICTH